MRGFKSPTLGTSDGLSIAVTSIPFYLSVANVDKSVLWRFLHIVFRQQILVPFLTARFSALDSLLVYKRVEKRSRERNGCGLSSVIYEEMGDDRIFSPRLKLAVAIRNLTREKNWWKEKRRRWKLPKWLWINPRVTPVGNTCDYIEVSYHFQSQTLFCFKIRRFRKKHDRFCNLSSIARGYLWLN